MANATDGGDIGDFSQDQGDSGDYSMDPSMQRMKHNNKLPIWKNTETMNLNHLILENIRLSSYFKTKLFTLKTYHEVIDEIYYNVTHLEPWERGTFKTAGISGMCGGVRGVSAGGVVSTAFCILYKLFTMRLTRKQLVGMLNHTDSPYIRALGFMYIRFCQPPETFWEWFEPYFDDEEEVDPKAGGGDSVTMGQFVKLMLTKLDWYNTLFPRIPVPIQKDIDKKLKEYNLKKFEDAKKDRESAQDMEDQKKAVESFLKNDKQSPKRYDSRERDKNDERRGHDRNNDRRGREKNEERRGEREREEKHDVRKRSRSASRQTGSRSKHSRHHSRSHSHRKDRRDRSRSLKSSRRRSEEKKRSKSTDSKRDRGEDGEKREHKKHKHHRHHKHRRHHRSHRHRDTNEGVQEKDISNDKPENLEKGEDEYSLSMASPSNDKSPESGKERPTKTTRDPDEPVEEGELIEN